MGVQAVRDGYRHLLHTLGLDAIVLADGGTDILMRGDEAGLGTPAEDIMSLAAVAALDVPARIVTCLGFGVDAFHGICHAHWLENVAALREAGGFLGAAALRKEMPEAQSDFEAVNAADGETIGRPSDLPAVARRNLYLDRLAHTRSIWDVLTTIEQFRNEVRSGMPETIPY